MMPLPFWLMIVSRAMAVLPVWRSPMISDRGHGVDRLEAGLHRLAHGHALDHARGDALDLHGVIGADRPLAVERDAQRVDHAAQERLAGRDLHDAAGPADLIPLLDQGDLAQQHGADVVLLEVEGHAHHPVGQLEQLAVHDLVEAVEPADPVTDGDHRAHLGHVGLPVVVLDLGPDDLADFVDLDLHDYS